MPVGSINQPRFDLSFSDAVLGKPFSDRCLDTQNTAGISIQRFRIPRIMVGASGDGALDNQSCRFMAHINNGFMNIIGAHNFLALVKNHPALVIHHIVIFQQLFADFKIAGLNLGLGLFDGLVNPGMHNGFTFFKAQLDQHTIQLFRAEDTHQIIL